MCTIVGCHVIRTIFFLLLIYMQVMLKFRLLLYFVFSIWRYTTTIAVEFWIVIKCEDNSVNERTAAGNLELPIIWKREKQARIFTTILTEANVHLFRSIDIRMEWNENSSSAKHICVCKQHANRIFKMGIFVLYSKWILFVRTFSSNCASIVYDMISIWISCIGQYYNFQTQTHTEKERSQFHETIDFLFDGLNACWAAYPVRNLAEPFHLEHFSFRASVRASAFMRIWTIHNMKIVLLLAQILRWRHKKKNKRNPISNTRLRWRVLFGELFLLKSIEIFIEEHFFFIFYWS